MRVQFCRRYEASSKVEKVEEVIPEKVEDIEEDDEDLSEDGGVG